MSSQLSFNVSDLTDSSIHDIRNLGVMVWQFA